mgnify:CR=1 FL=1
MKDCEFNRTTHIPPTAVVNPKNVDKDKSVTRESIDEDVPSTSKCGKCYYPSDTEGDLRAHMESDHEDEILLNLLSS